MTARTQIPCFFGKADTVLETGDILVALGGSESFGKVGKE
jgi:hypothetical protein